MIHFNEIQGILEQLKKQWLQKSPNTIDALYTKDAELISSAHPAIYRGNQEIASFYPHLFKDSVTQVTTLNISEKWLSDELASVYWNIQLQFKAVTFQNVHMSLLIKKHIHQSKILLHHISFHKKPQL